MFWTRLVSGIILVALALLVIITGGDVLLAVMCALSLVGMFELYRVLKVEKKLPGLLGYAAIILYYMSVRFNFVVLQIFIFSVFMILLLAVFVFGYPKYEPYQIFGTFFGFFYVGVMLSYMYQTRVMLQNGQFIVWLIFLCSWGCDTCAYCVGVLFGKHKMAPVLSPKKSIEGAIGGVAGSVLLTALYLYIVKGYMGIESKEVWILAGIAGIGALVSMIGDLAASAIKRFYDIKDYGKLIPGHGGVLDRFDSVIITAPIVYYLAAMALALQMSF